MEYRSLSVAVTVGLAFVLAACGGGGSGTTAPTVSNLAGTWYGNYDLLGTATTISVVVGSGNSVTSVSIGGFDAGLTGSLAVVQNNLYRYVLNQGGVLYDEGGFIVDAAEQHAGFLSSQGDFGVVEKGGVAVTYTQGDIANTNWAGYTITLDWQGNVTSYNSSTASVDINSAFSGNDGTQIFTSTSNLVLTAPADGSYTGTFTGSSTGAGDVKVWLSPDKTFAAAYGCASGKTPADGLDLCTYSAWNKQ